MSMMERQALWMEKKAAKVAAKQKLAAEAEAASIVGKPNLGKSKNSLKSVLAKQDLMKKAAEKARETAAAVALEQKKKEEEEAAKEKAEKAAKLAAKKLKKKMTKDKKDKKDKEKAEAAAEQPAPAATTRTMDPLEDVSFEHEEALEVVSRLASAIRLVAEGKKQPCVTSDMVGGLFRLVKRRDEELTMAIAKEAVILDLLVANMEVLPEASEVLMHLAAGYPSVCVTLFDHEGLVDGPRGPTASFALSHMELCAAVGVTKAGRSFRYSQLDVDDVTITWAKGRVNFTSSLGGYGGFSGGFGWGRF
ncbi:hypothetical protein TeGR_g11967 [Tetraparma gracilis]|uniref:Uncharacterized protein n=1 Tax=Tetraparma gracilis TaxID=2962635 RepID=A0ABQ6NC72_9STRA|nr:hypothetical protein TeGR_g11967 [Tetraparma gracilis]